MPIDIYTSSLLHFDGADGSTTFTDETGKVWTANLTAQLDTDDKKFGTASLRIDSTANCRISTPSTDDLNFEDSDFTIDFWVKKAAEVSANNTNFISKISGVSTNKEFEIWIGASGSNNRAVFYTNGSSEFVLLTNNISIPVDGNFYHIAVVRFGNTWGLATNGVFDSFVTDSRSVFVTSETVKIGNFPSTAGGKPNSWIDEVRIKKGIAMWRTNFTPPTRPYGNYPQQITIIGDRYG
jgi:hypothetical protein